MALERPTPGVRRIEPPSDPKRAAWDRFHNEARKLRKGWLGCEVCPPEKRDPEAITEVHHVISQRRLKLYAVENSLPDLRLLELLTDPRNSIVLCKECHSLHTLRFQRLPLSSIPKAAWDFATDQGLKDEMIAEYRSER